jgi:long-chain acyl-CoA synthetase
VKISFVEDMIKKTEIAVKNCRTKHDDVVVVSHTSGTSGSPKGVMITNKNIVFVTKKYIELYGLDANSKTFAALPLWHNYGMFACLLSSLLSGGILIIIDVWAPENALSAMQKHSVTVFPGSPHMYIDMVNCNLKKYKLQLKVCDSGGYSLPVEYIKRFEKRTGALITEGYGLTETTSLTHFNFRAKNRIIGSIGKCIPEASWKILSENKRVETGQYGILWIKGPMVCKGYVSKDVSSFKSGWFNTGDIVKVEKDGSFYIAGRISDIKNIKKLNQNFPKHIEEHIYKYKYVVRACVKQKNRKNHYNLFVILKDNKYKKEFTNFLKDNIKNTMFDKIYFTDNLPTTSTGKIKNNLLALRNIKH